MNSFKGEITNLQTSGELSRVKIQIGSEQLSTIVIGNSESMTYLGLGNRIQVIFKETEVIIAKGDTSAVSLQNQIKGQISRINKGDLLSKIEVNTNIGIVKSIITSNAVQQLELKEGEEVIAMIKSNEIMLAE